MMNKSANRAILIDAGGDESSRRGVAEDCDRRDPCHGMARDGRDFVAGSSLLRLIVQLHDGRVGFYHTWHPPVMAWLLGLGDTLVSGTGLFVVLDAALFFGALLSLLWIVPRVSWAAAIVAALIVLLPQTFLYQAIVWKDVLFADSAVAGFVCLAHAAARWVNIQARIIWIVAAFGLFVLATLTRQNGLIVLGVGTGALGVVALHNAGKKAAFVHSGIAFMSAVAVTATVSFALSLRSDGGEGPKAQLRLLRLYDLIGAVAANRRCRLIVSTIQTPNWNA